MLKLDTRPPWPSSPPVFSDAKAAAPEFSLPTLQSTSSTSSVFSRFSSKSTVMGGVICMSENSISHHCSPASSRSRGVARSASASGDTGREDPSWCLLVRHETAAHSERQPGDSPRGANGRRPAGPADPAAALGGQQEQLNVSRTKAGPDGSGSGTLLAAKPTAVGDRPALPLPQPFPLGEVSAVGTAGGSTRPLKPTGLSLPLIQPASSDVVAVGADGQIDSSRRASSSSCLPSSLLPSISEPHPPSFRGRASSPSSPSVPTDNTPANGPKPAAAARGQSPSPSPSPLCPPPPAALQSPPLLQLAQAAASATATATATAAATASAPIHAHKVASVLSSDLIGAAVDGDSGRGAVVAGISRCLPPSSPSSPPDALIDSWTSKKRTFNEYQSDVGTKLTGIACSRRRFPPPGALGGITNPSKSPTSKDLPAVVSAGSTLGPTHVLPGPPSDIKGAATTSHRIDHDSLANSNLVLAHRAVAAIRSESLPRSKLIRSLIAAGKSNLYPFSILRAVHDGVMETDDDSDTDSVATTASRRQRMMPPWQQRKQMISREESPSLSDPFIGLDPNPLPGPRPLAPSTPKQDIFHPGVFTLIQGMGDNNHRALAEELHCQQIDAAENGDQRIDKTGERSHESEKVDSGVNGSSTNMASQSSFPPSKPGGGSSGDGDEDPNKRLRKLSEHEEDNDPDIAYSSRFKRRRLGFEEFEGQPESQSRSQAERDAVVSSLFSLSKGPSPPPIPSGPSTATTMDTGPTYSETVATPATVSEYHKSPVDNAPSVTLPPIHPGPNYSPRKSPTSPRTTHATLPSVSSLLTAAEEMKPMGSAPINSHHPQSGGRQFSRAKVVQHLNVTVPSASNPAPTLHPRNFVDSYSRPSHFNDPSSQYRTTTPRGRISPTISPTEKKLPPIAPAPPKFPARASSSPTRYTPMPSYYPPRNLNRPEHHAPLPPIQTEWSTPVTPSETNSAKTPTSKLSKRGRNGTPKHGSGDSSQSSPSVAGGFKCTEEGCTAAPFSTQYLLNSHANVHSEDRPHFCPVPGCQRAEGGKGFKRKNEMIRHGLVHQSPGYACPFCPDKEHKYPRPDNLQRHVKAHHKDKSSDDPMLREVLAVRPEGGQRGRRRRLGPST